jgi:ribosomal protein S18 acetylase RimI-like enzyme
MATTIRKAELNDLPMIQEIARRTIDKCYRPFLGDDGVDWFINGGESDKELEKHIDNCRVLLHDTYIRGFSIFFDDLIHLMMVDVNFHRKGLGKQLLAYSENELFESGNTILRLETFEGNHQAISFYKNNGWNETKRKKDEEFEFIRVYFEKHK